MPMPELREARGPAAPAAAGGASAPPEERVLVLAPTGRDADLACTVLRGAGLTPDVCRDTEELCRRVEAGAGAALLAEEALAPRALPRLIETLDAQPPWSDFPLVILPCAGEATHARLQKLRLLEPLRNVTFLERPVRVMTLVSALRAALAARRRQYEVRDLLRQLEEAVRARDEFLAMLGHELRNPLGVVSNALEVLGRPGGAGDRTGELHALISHHAGHLRRLVDDLLDVARVSSGKIVLQRRPLDLRDVARRCLEALRLEAGHPLPPADAFDFQGRALRLEADPDPVPVDGDPARLEQVLTNLLTNACKYTPPGGRVDVSVRRQGGEAVLAVRDTGMGIALEALPHLFEPFRQVVDSLARTRGGLGLGLTLVRRLAELHGGGVSAASAGPGRGSEFVVRLPLREERAGPGEAEPGRDGAAPSPFPPPASGRRVLVVEDNTGNRDTLRLLLQLWGHQVEEAEDGAGGLRRLLAAPPDVAVIDIGLPGLDGYEVARRVRASPAGGRVVLIALSGYGQPDDQRRALEAGFNAYLVKPVEPQVLARLVSGGPVP